MKKLIYLIVLTLILGLVLTGCFLSNVGQVPTTGQSGITYLTKTIQLPDPGLVGLWRFNEGSGQTAGDATGVNDGQLGSTIGVDANDPSWVADQWGGYALSFDGNDDYVGVLDSSTLEPPTITVEAWVKNSETPGIFKYIISKVYVAKLGGYSSYAFYTGGSGGLRFYVGFASNWVGSPDAGASLWDGNWHHIAGTYDGSNVRLFVDGSQVVGTGTSATPTIAYDGGNLYIGYYGPYAYPTYFPGFIDEVRIWRSALADTQLDDMTPPVIDITTPNDGAIYLLNQIVPAEWSADDGTGTGVAYESGTVPSGSAIDTSTVGTHTFTVTATDYAKNEANKTVTYYVNYVFNGFLPPVSLGKPFKMGSTIPIKFQLTDVQGVFVTNASPSISRELISGGTPSGEVIDGNSSGAANTDSTFRYDPDSNQYIFNLATKGLTAPATYRITVDLGDGTTKEVYIGLK